MLAALTLAVLIYAVLQLVGWPFGRRITLPASPVLWNSLLISAFFLFLLDLTAISKDLLPAGIHFLAILLNVKLLTLQDRRDYRHIFAISLMGSRGHDGPLVYMGFPDLPVGRHLELTPLPFDRQDCVR